MTKRLLPKKSLGQHFLRDDGVHEEILHLAGLTKEERVFEIGAGDGTLTRSLGELAGRVIAIETDRRCLALLRREFPRGGAVEILEADILSFDFSTLEDEAPLKVVADLPYNIATAVLDRLLEHKSLFPLMVLMFQKEVGLRLTAQGGSRTYGSLSLATQYRSEVELVRVVPPEAFTPRPKVESALLRLVPRRRPLLPPEAEKVFARLIRDGFTHRRKTFLNSLSRAGSPFPAADIADILAGFNMTEKVRAEDITFDQFLDLARQLACPSGGDP